MAKKPKSEAAAVEPMEKVARLLAILVTRGVEPDEAMPQLSGAGFDDHAVSQILGVSESAIRGMRFRSKKPKKRPRKTAKKIAR